MVFQMMFAIITPALISGAFAERMKFSAFVLFTVLWSTFVYDPLAHWVWGDGGWLNKGALDFAGGTVVHISSGVSALVCAVVLGKRKATGISRCAPQPAHDPDRRGPAVVRLVRVQRRQRARAGGLAASAFWHEHRRGGRRAGLDDHGVDDARQADRARRRSGPSPGSWRSRRPPASSVRWRRSSSAHRGRVCFIACNSSPARLRRLAGRVRRARRGRYLGRPRHRAVRLQGVNEAAGDGLFFGDRASWGRRSWRCWRPRLAIVGTFVILKVVDAVVGLRVPTRKKWSGSTCRSTRRRPTRQRRRVQRVDGRRGGGSAEAGRSTEAKARAAH